MRRFFVLLGIVLLVGYLLFLACNRNGPPVDMVIPKGFTGPIWIILDESAPEIPLVEGRYRVIVPTDGVLRVRSFAPFERWHTFTAKYEDGSPVPNCSGGTIKDPDCIALRGGQSVTVQRHGGEYRWIEDFVGTEKQTSEFHRSDQLPPGVRKQ